MIGPVSVNAFSLVLAVFFNLLILPVLLEKHNLLAGLTVF